MQQACPVPTRMILLRRIIAREEKSVKLVGKGVVLLVEVAVDGNLITSRTPDDPPAFMRVIIAHLT
jgi:putative intracellular protease/amidase